MWKRHKLLIIGITMVISGAVFVFWLNCAQSERCNIPLLIDQVLKEDNGLSALTLFGNTLAMISGCSILFGALIITIAAIKYEN